MKMNQLIGGASLAFLAAGANAAEPHWGQITPKECVDSSHREWSAILWDVPKGQDWEQACKSTPGSVQGGQPRVPDRCVTKSNQWGVWIQPDANCNPPPPPPPSQPTSPSPQPTTGAISIRIGYGVGYTGCSYACDGKSGTVTVKSSSGQSESKSYSYFGSCVNATPACSAGAFIGNLQPGTWTIVDSASGTICQQLVVVGQIVEAKLRTDTGTCQ